ncbi:hypothetical protein J2X97_000538 [Epilithonimonas hungarica]|jgi:hypothetical protein|nr:hypothetical protein [Epilithonimonas hungarica]
MNSNRNLNKLIVELFIEILQSGFYEKSSFKILIQNFTILKEENDEILTYIFPDDIYFPFHNINDVIPIKCVLCRFITTYKRWEMME